MLTPLPPSKWDHAAAAHLCNRAGFGNTPEAIDKLVRLKPQEAVRSFLNFSALPDTAKPACAAADDARQERMKAARAATPEERQKMRREDQRSQRDLLVGMRQWWLERMLATPHPLQEKLTLFWHGHFATSAQKVREAHLMWLQNDLFRAHGLGSWPELLTRVSQDPAMLLWLDQAQSRRQQPNENYARELMELFTLGEGNYTEKDVTEAARALTGWSYDRIQQKFATRPALHDNGLKTILGQTGNFDGRDLIRIIVAHPQSSRFITARLWNFFAGEMPSNELNEALAKKFREANHTFKPLLEAVFVAEEFYSPTVVRNQVKSPVQWLVGSAKLLERPLPNPQLTQGVLRTLGQDLLMPPNVKGWDGGLSWITTSNLLARNNFAGFLVTGENPLNNRSMGAPGKGRPRNRPMASAAVQIDKLLTKEEQSSKPKLIAALERRFIQGPLREKQRLLLAEYLDAQADIDPQDVLHAIRMVMSAPEYQLA